MNVSHLGYRTWRRTSICKSVDGIPLLGVLLWKNLVPTEKPVRAACRRGFQEVALSAAWFWAFPLRFLTFVWFRDSLPANDFWSGHKLQLNFILSPVDWNSTIELNLFWNCYTVYLFIFKLLQSAEVFLLDLFWNCCIVSLFLLKLDNHSLSQPNLDNWSWLHLPEKQLILFNKACVFIKHSLRLDILSNYICLFNLSTNK